MNTHVIPLPKSSMFPVEPYTIVSMEEKNHAIKPMNSDQNLTHAEEKELVRWITRLTISGYPPRYETLRRLAEIIRERRIKTTDYGEVQVKVYDKIGKEWVPRFLQRHSELASVRPRSIDAARIKDTSPERLQRWFDDLKKVLAEFNIKPENIYNMDESGFAIGEKEAGRCIINAQYSSKISSKAWASRMGHSGGMCLCRRKSLFLLSSFSKRKIYQHNGFQRVFMAIGGLIATQKDGQAMSMGWTGSKRCFDPETRDKADGEYRLLICDGHDSHITGDFIAHCMDNNILLMILPPHSSHLTQPLDVGVFGALKKQMATEIEPLMRTGVARIQKIEWLTAFVAAHDKAS